MAGQPIYLVRVQTMRGFGQVGSASHPVRHGHKGQIVSREAGSPVGGGRLEVLPSDAAVVTERLRDDVGIGIGQPLTQLRQHVGVGDLGRHECIHSQLGDLGIDKAHAGDKRLIQAEGPRDRLDHVPGVDASDSPISVRSGDRMSSITLPRAMNSGL